MSERDLQRIEVLSKVTEGRTTIASAAHALALSTRHVRRLLDVFEDDGAAAIRRKSRDRPSNNRISNGVRDYVLTLIRERYLDFGPTLAAEKLAENHSVAVSRETLRKWMTEAGIWLSRKQRRTFHQPCLRRESYGPNYQYSKIFPCSFKHLPPLSIILYPPALNLMHNRPTVLTGTRIMSRMFVEDGGAGWRASGASVGDEPHIRASENRSCGTL
jgi:transposase